MTGYVAHYGVAYRVGSGSALMQQSALPVVDFSDSGKARVCSPGGYLYEFDDSFLLRELGMKFMKVTRADISSIPDQEDR